jgi:hypothetical protein
MSELGRMSSLVTETTRNNPKPKSYTEGPTRNEPKPMSWPEGPTETDNFVFSGNFNNNVIVKESL